MNHRLKTVGYEGKELFDRDAVERITLYSKGIPRLINVICDNALLIAYAASKRKVSAEMVEEVARDLQLGAPRPIRVPARLALGAYAASLAAVSARVAEPGKERDAAALPVVFAIMHLTWGFGFLWSVVRFGPPLAALARLVRRVR